MYCSIEEAFETVPPVSTGGSSNKKSKRSRRIQGFQNPTPDPDRPTVVPPPPVDAVGGGTNTNATSYSNLLSAIDADQSYFPNPSDDMPSDSAYMLEPDWTKQFQGQSVPPWIRERVAEKTAEIPLQPAASMDGHPTLWQSIPAAYTAPPPTPAAPIYPDLDERFLQFESKLDAKLNHMFEKLSQLDKAKSESNHIEIILFVIGGLFVLLMLDMLVKQGTRAVMMMAAAGGGLAAAGGSMAVPAMGAAMGATMGGAFRF